MESTRNFLGKSSIKKNKRNFLGKQRQGHCGPESKILGGSVKKNSITTPSGIGERTRLDPATRKSSSLLFGYVHTQFSNTIHKFWVLHNMLLFCFNHARATEVDHSLKLYLIVIYRGLRHDLSKYRWSEAKYFARTICRLKAAEYGSPEYQRMLADLQPCLCLHYSRNRHHPEHYQHGIHDMNRYDLIEMVADWGAATRRSANGDIVASIQRNSERFGYDRMMIISLTADARLMGLI